MEVSKNKKEKQDTDVHVYKKMHDSYELPR